MTPSPVNLAAREAARQHEGDPGEELHAMDYLVYAYLQTGREAEAAKVIQELSNMPTQNSSDFKIAYASTAMPIRYAVERGKWADAAAIVPPTSAPPHVHGDCDLGASSGTGTKRPSHRSPRHRATLATDRIAAPHRRQHLLGRANRHLASRNCSVVAPKPPPNPPKPSPPCAKPPTRKTPWKNCQSLPAQFFPPANN